MALIFHQLFEAESCTYTYLLADDVSREALLVDPVLETAPRDEALVRELGLCVKRVLETHCHADHVSGAAWFADRWGSETWAHGSAGIRIARPVADGERIPLGAMALEALHTPGHTDGDVCFRLLDRVFTGDTLLIGGCGRTDFQQGDAGRLFDSIQRLFTLPAETQVLPAHDYQGRRSTSIGKEKCSNARAAGRSREEFVALMHGLNLPYPKHMQRAVPANQCGGAGAAPQKRAVQLPPQRFFAIPRLTLVSVPECGNDTPAQAHARGCGAAGPVTALFGQLPPDAQGLPWITLGDSAPCLPMSRTLGLIGPTGAECEPVAESLTRGGYDVVILQGGLEGLAASAS